MIKVEGYKAFHGKMKISPVSGIEPFVLECDWLYKPDTGCWYGKGQSFGEKICEIVSDEAIINGGDELVNELCKYGKIISDEFEEDEDGIRRIRVITNIGTVFCLYQKNGETIGAYQIGEW